MRTIHPRIAAILGTCIALSGCATWNREAAPRSHKMTAIAYAAKAKGCRSQFGCWYPSTNTGPFLAGEIYSTVATDGKFILFVGRFADPRCWAVAVLPAGAAPKCLRSIG